MTVHQRYRQTDRRTGGRHARSISATCVWHVVLAPTGRRHAVTLNRLSKLDAECDQQVTVVGILLIALGHVHRRRQVMST